MVQAASAGQRRHQCADSLGCSPRRWQAEREDVTGLSSEFDEHSIRDGTDEEGSHDPSTSLRSSNRCTR